MLDMLSKKKGGRKKAKVPQRKIKNLLQSAAIAKAFLAICGGYCTLTRLSDVLGIGKSSLQLYLKQLMEAGLVTRKSPREEKTWFYPYEYHVNAIRFLGVKMIDGKISFIGVRRHLIHPAEIFLPDFAKKFTEGKLKDPWGQHVTEITLDDLQKTFNGYYIKHLLNKDKRTEEEQDHLDLELISLIPNLAESLEIEGLPSDSERRKN